MLKLYENDFIDRNKWDALIDSSDQGVIYAKSWYLDTLFPNWKALISEESSSYNIVIPFCPKSRFGIHSIHHPFFSQQLGIFTRTRQDEVRALEYLVGYWIKHYRYVDYYFNSENSASISVSPFSGLFRKRITYLLPLDKELHLLKENFSTNLKRNLKRAGKSKVHLREENDPAPLIALFRKHKGSEIRLIKNEHYSQLKKLCLLSGKFAGIKFLAARNEQGELIAGALFLFYKNKIIYLFGSGSPEGKEKGALPAIFELLIRQYAGTGKVLDFEGSDIPGLARFYSGFGASPHIYYAFHLDRIKWLTGLVSFLKRKLSFHETQGELS